MNNTLKELSASPNSTSSRVTRVGRWLGIVLFLIVWFLPTPAGLSPAGQRLLATTLLMGTYWLTSAIPIYVTSLIPLSLFPILGILSAKEVAASYISHTVFLYFGGFVIALGIERWGLHRRIALRILTSVGSSPQRVVLGFMLATGFLSMWISNTATTLLMLPIALSLTTSLREVSGDQEQNHSYFETALLLGIAYSASIGGMLTLVGTPTNVAFVEIFQRNFPEAPEISMGAWITAFLPLGLIFFLIVWWKLCRSIERTTPVGKHFFRERLSALGPASQGEKWMLAVFGVTAALWMFRSDLDFGLGFVIPGWKHLAARWLVSGLSMGQGDHPIDIMQAAGFLNDSTVAMTMCILMFLIPVTTGSRESKHKVPLMDWETLNKMPWGILLLFGGGFALADAFTSTGLSNWIGFAASELLGTQPTWVIVAGVCFVLTFMTEFTTNVATVSALLPVLAALSLNLGIDPRLIMIPATLSTSCAFMLPIATPPNAIVFGSGRIRTQDMAKHGIVLNLIGVVLITVVTFTWALPRLGIDVNGPKPSWAVPLSEVHE
ncbi:MAG: SLC13 family permease [Planctomycetaceae bacterium]|nr:SLC13 family permease [bacterium]MDG2388993.1 SLC13 family permease [Planctomycetaceae bacterium]